MTDLYPICPAGSELQRIYDFPSCWDGQNLESEKQNTHIVFPDKSGNCSSDTVPVPALRLTVSYGNMPAGRQFAIDSFPEQQHNPITDHALMEYISTERRAEAGAQCINSGQRCVQGRAQNLAFSTDPRDQLPRSMTYMHAMASMGQWGMGDTSEQDLTASRMMSVLLPGVVIVLAVLGRRGLLLAWRRRARLGRRLRTARRPARGELAVSDEVDCAVEPDSDPPPGELTGDDPDVDDVRVAATAASS